MCRKTVRLGSGKKPLKMNDILIPTITCCCLKFQELKTALFKGIIFDDLRGLLPRSAASRVVIF